MTHSFTIPGAVIYILLSSIQSFRWTRWGSLFQIVTSVNQALIASHMLAWRLGAFIVQGKRCPSILTVATIPVICKTFRQECKVTLTLNRSLCSRDECYTGTTLPKLLLASRTSLLFDVPIRRGIVYLRWELRVPLFLTELFSICSVSLWRVLKDCEPVRSFIIQVVQIQEDTGGKPEMEL